LKAVAGSYGIIKTDSIRRQTMHSQVDRILKTRLIIKY